MEIQLSAGVLPTQNFTSGNTYKGAADGSTVVENKSSADKSHSAFFNDQHDITIENITFRGNGLKGDNARNITLKNCRIEDCNRTSGDHQGLNVSNANGLVLDHVTFKNCTYCAIFNGTSKNILVIDSRAENCGIHLKALFSPGSDNIKVERFVVDRPRGCYYAVEFQPNFDHRLDPNYTNISVIDCAYRRPNIGTITTDTGFISVPMEHAKGPVIVTGNYINGLLANGQRHVKGPAMVLEVSAGEAVVENNWIEHCNDPVAINSNSIHAIVQNNKIIDCHEPANMQGGAPVGQNVFKNNGPDVKLPEKGGWSLFGVSSGGVTVPTNNPTILVSPAEGLTLQAGQLVTAEGKGDNLRWEIDIENDGKPEIKIGTGNSIVFQIPGKADEKTQDVRVRLFGDGGMIERKFKLTPLPTNRTIKRLIIQYSDNTEEVR